jgi:protein-S-isoprenylcysteine O-methyltransferase Ste14
VTADRAAALLYGLTFVGWFVLEVRQAVRRRPDASHGDRGSLWVLRATTVCGFVLAFALAALVPAWDVPRGLALVASVALLWCGIALRWWSFRTLGEYFTFTVQTTDDQAVVDTGPYRWVRHPAYLGMLLAILGIGAVSGNPLTVVVLLVAVLVGVVYRIRVEEQALLASVGEPYRRYCEGRARLVPGVW